LNSCLDHVSILAQGPLRLLLSPSPKHNAFVRQDLAKKICTGARRKMNLFFRQTAVQLLLPKPGHLIIILFFFLKTNFQKLRSALAAKYIFFGGE
jgi:hypothetical protein